MLSLCKHMACAGGNLTAMTTGNDGQGKSWLGGYRNSDPGSKVHKDALHALNDEVRVAWSNDGLCF